MDRQSNLKLVSKTTRRCPCAENSSSPSACENKKAGIDQEDKYPWWISSAAHNHCFWLYVRDKSDVSGTMKELVQAELAHLFGWSNTKTHFMLKQAMQELSDAFVEHRAVDLLQDLHTDNSDFTSLLDDLINHEYDEQSE